MFMSKNKETIDSFKQISCSIIFPFSKHRNKKQNVQQYFQKTKVSKLETNQIEKSVFKIVKSHYQHFQNDFPKNRSNTMNINLLSLADFKKEQKQDNMKRKIKVKTEMKMKEKKIRIHSQNFSPELHEKSRTVSIQKMNLSYQSSDKTLINAFGNQSFELRRLSPQIRGIKWRGSEPLISREQIQFMRTKIPKQKKNGFQISHSLISKQESRTLRKKRKFHHASLQKQLGPWNFSPSPGLEC